MSNSATMNIAGLAVPKVNAATLMTILLAGAMATVAFDFFGQSLSPMLGFSKLAPVPLANAVISVVFGQSVASAVYGVALWVFALYIMAHLIAGNPPFLGFTGITWVALVGHVVFAVVAAWVVRWRERD